MSHARLSPSAASRWTACPGYLNAYARRGIIDTSGEAAELGTAAHELLEWCLLDNNQPEEHRGDFFNKCTLKPGGFVVDDNMIDAVQVMVDLVNSRPVNSELFAERKVNPGQFFGRQDCTGTADVTIVHDTEIEVQDYKHGERTLVEVDGNLQLILYGIGALAEMPIEQRKTIKTVKIGIVQPRCFHRDGPIRSVTYTVEEIYGWAMWFGARAKATDDPDAQLVPGVKQCNWCPIKKSKGGCSALATKTIKVFQVQKMEDIAPKVLRDVSELTPEQETWFLDNAGIIEQFLKALKSNGQKKLLNGTRVTGQKLVRGKAGNRKFTKESPEMIKYLMKEFKVKKKDLVEEPDILGVQKILTLVKKTGNKKDEKFIKKLEDLNALVTRADGKLTMAPESDPRPSAGSQRAIDAFKNIPIIKTGESV